MSNIIHQHVSNIKSYNQSIQRARSNNGDLGKPFSEILNEKIESEVKFSKHASQRLEERDILLSKEHIERINDAFSLANKKGIRDTLIILDKMAFIGNVKSKTIITATTEDSLKNNVFTNIDGTVIV